MKLATLLNDAKQEEIAIDLHGSYRDDKPFWNSSTTTSPGRLRADLESLSPQTVMQWP